MDFPSATNFWGRIRGSSNVTLLMSYLLRHKAYRSIRELFNLKGEKAREKIMNLMLLCYHITGKVLTDGSTLLQYYNQVKDTCGGASGGALLQNTVFNDRDLEDVDPMWFSMFNTAASVEAVEEFSFMLDTSQCLRVPECKVCFSASVSQTFIPCGHLVTCWSCSCRLLSCPICRARIKQRQDTRFVRLQV